ncbi:hypothetical protein PHYSODRAFT_320878 [Phytophthora sojae]|uniref:Uncharacterized protein n=1 Tax=Phytophthora sojae (strain P6497) TaxID=1094619 RepID=G4YGR0_PHYSP|nr:hypothetical protein PHYSODRAFT_320878 [Phytophthora sojae]EGZ27019.1 hypothetical protein PHYSODRAFT_320878 [Phytophthora sojae]|eukprot:XP_009514294.1 hypothetical protein PHYSODRAFT_320878 [Phytophthora sojae]
MLNEEVVMESLKAMRTSKITDAADASEHLSQIKELVVCISQERQRRDSALAAVLAHEYQENGKESGHFAEDKKMLSAIHGRLASIYRKLEQNQEELRALQLELNKRVRCLNAEPPTCDTELKEVQELTNKLEAAMVAQTTLETHRQVLCAELLRLDGGVGMLTSVMIEQATQSTRS